MQFPKVKLVKAIEKYKLQLVFTDGTQRQYDLSDMAGKGVFKIWDVEDNFFKVFINRESGTISWPGEIEIDTINAYCIIKGITPENYFNNQMKYAVH